MTNSGYYLAVGWVLLSVVPPALAQEESAAAGPNWVLSYTLVVLAIALGLTVVCRMGRRSQEIKHPEA